LGDQVVDGEDRSSFVRNYINTRYWEYFVTKPTLWLEKADTTAYYRSSGSTGSESFKTSRFCTIQGYVAGLRCGILLLSIAASETLPRQRSIERRRHNRTGRLVMQLGVR